MIKLAEVLTAAMHNLEPKVEKQTVEADARGILVHLYSWTYRPRHTKLDKGAVVKVVFNPDRPDSVEVRTKGIVENWYPL